MRCAVIAVVLAITSPVFADDDFGGATIVFARGGSLYRVDPKGKNETEIATVTGSDGPRKVVRNLQTDAAGKILLVDLDGAWQWMPLDGSAKSLTALACSDGPAQLAEDGTCVLCKAKTGSQIINLMTGKTLTIDQAGARVTGIGADRKLVWADKDGVWSAAPGHRQHAKKVAPESPLRSFLASPDGSRALGVYSDEVFVDAHHKKPMDILMGFQLDGEGARRKAIKGGVPLMWSHDSQWVLVQDGGQACLMHATGGEYKCWRGYTAASISSDGKYGVFLDNRDGSHKQAPEKDPKTKKGKKPAPKNAEPPPPPPGEESGESEEGDAGEADVAVPPPSGSLSVFRARLEGSAFTESPALIIKVADGAAVWVPGTP